MPAAHPVPGISGAQAAEASPRFPPTLFSIPFGLAELGQVWQAARSVLRAPAAVADVIFIAAAAVWVFLVARYLAQGRRQVLADLRDSVLSPYLCLPAITAMILATALFSYAHLPGRVLVGVLLAVTAITDGMLTGQWIAAGVDRDALHPVGDVNPNWPQGGGGKWPRLRQRGEASAAGLSNDHLGDRR